MSFTRAFPPCYNGQDIFGFWKAEMGNFALCGERPWGTMRSVPVKTGTAYATNMPPAYSLYAAAPGSPPAFEKAGPKLSSGGTEYLK